MAKATKKLEGVHRNLTAQARMDRDAARVDAANNHRPKVDRRGRPPNPEPDAKAQAAWEPVRKADVRFEDAKERRGAMAWLSRNGFWPRFRGFLQERTRDQAAEIMDKGGIPERTNELDKEAWEFAWKRLHEVSTPEAVRTTKSRAMADGARKRTEARVEEKLAVAEAARHADRAAAVDHMIEDIEPMRLAELLDKRCPPEVAVDWVAHSITAKAVTWEQAPSFAAWNMLQWVRSSRAAEATFWGTIHRQLMPDKKELERRKRLDADGDDIVALNEATIAKLEANEKKVAAALERRKADEQGVRDTPIRSALPIPAAPPDPKVKDWDEDGNPIEVEVSTELDTDIDEDPATIEEDPPT